MNNKTVSGIMLTLLSIGMLTLAFNIQPVEASGTTYIGSDYTFTSNIYEQIVVTADNIIVDGNGYTLQGLGSGTGIDLTGRSNVTLKNVEVTNFKYGIYLSYSNNNTLTGNIASNYWAGIWLDSSGNNVLFHNNFFNNTQNTRSYNSINLWDDGYPSGGNYWSDYNGTDFYSGQYQNETGSDGIGDTPYTIDENNKDMYPLVHPFILADFDGDFYVDFWDVLHFVDAYREYARTGIAEPSCDFDLDLDIDVWDILAFVDCYREYGRMKQ